MGYRWECPYCGQTRTNAAASEAGEANALGALRSHIIATDGADHGPHNELPADAETLALSEYVENVQPE